MGRVRTTRPILVALLVVLLLPAPAAVAASTVLDWQPCADDPSARCAVLRVPVETDGDGYAETLPIAVAKRPATQPAQRIGTLIVNPGGPGGSGVDMVIDAPRFFSAALRARFDIVGFDPRGVGRSSPVICARSLLDTTPSPLVATKSAYRKLLGFHRALTEDCARRSGPVYRHADTLSVVRDMDRLRHALGEERISFYGASYGTLLGTQYAALYPRRTRALVLDSVMDHSVDTAQFLAEGTAAAQDAFAQFAGWCGRSPDCVLHGKNVRVLWQALLARAAAGTLVDPYRPGFRPNVFDLLDVAFGSFYDPQWSSLAYYIQEALTGPPARRAAGPPTAENSFPAIFCSDYRFPTMGYASYARRLATLRASAPDMRASSLALSSVAACLGRSGPIANPQRPFARTPVPTLVVGSRHDPATPYIWATRVAAQLGPNASMVTYLGWGHVSYGRTTCVTGLIDRYLISLTRPAPGAACPGVLPPPSGVG
ncbi:alpha/beta hydrolase [Actinoplanes sp. NPDC049265]|uniref:alpha/beta hydrolase n=1 Tax=Actinoplanes sp. NPDC049265 TaxID=3363902 RepID=UPI00371465F5